MEGRCATICRIDKSSVKRHKSRWHCLPKKESCTFVPSDAVEVHELRRKYQKSKSHSTNGKSKEKLPVKPDKLLLENLSAIPDNSLQASEDKSSQSKKETGTADSSSNTFTTGISDSDDEIGGGRDVDQFGMTEPSRIENLVHLDDTGSMNCSATYPKTG